MLIFDVFFFIFEPRLLHRQAQQSTLRRDIPFTVVERVTIGSRTAMQPRIVVQRFKPRQQGIARPLTRWIVDRVVAASKRASLIPHPNNGIAIRALTRPARR